MSWLDDTARVETPDSIGRPEFPFEEMEQEEPIDNPKLTIGSQGEPLSQSSPTPAEPPIEMNGHATLDVNQLSEGIDGTKEQVRLWVERPLGLSEENHFRVSWKNLTYYIGKGKKKRSIFKDLTGHFRSGHLTALMGPSGVGKSTLLECICGFRKKGRFGDVLFTGIGEVNFSFIPQQDTFFTALTVIESLSYALDFYDRGTYSRKSDRRDHINQVIRQLGLEGCQNNRISKCSGGQLKRISIAQELITRPNILILDEPTSGLDSVSCLHVVQLLKELASHPTRPMAIVATMHQPSANVFNLFDKVYTLSCIGRCIFEGSPQDMTGFFSRFGLNIPNQTNPADFMIEVAAGTEATMEQLKDIARVQDQKSRYVSNMVDTFTRTHADVEESDFEKRVFKPKLPLLWHLTIHCRRSFLVTIRNFQLGVLRLGNHVVTGCFLGYLYSMDGIGQADGCPPSGDQASDPMNFRSLVHKNKLDMRNIQNNTGLWIFSQLFLLFSSMMPIILSYPMEMNTYVKECANGWYTPMSYFLGKSLSDVPFLLLCPILYQVPLWYLSHQPMEWTRFGLVYVACLLTGATATSFGMVIGAVFMDNVLAAVFVGPTSTIPLIIFSGFFIRTSDMPPPLQPGLFISFVRYSLNITLISLYGLNRCGHDAAAQLRKMQQSLFLFLLSVFKQSFSIKGDDDVLEMERTNNITSSMVDGITSQFNTKISRVNGLETVGVLAEFELTDSDLIHGICMLIFYFMFYRFLAYIVIVRKSALSK